MENDNIFRKEATVEVAPTLLQPISYTTENGETVVEFLHHPMRTVLVMDQNHFQIMWREGESLHSFVADYNPDAVDDDTNTFHVFTMSNQRAIVYNVVADDADNAWEKVKQYQPDSLLVSVTQGNLEFPVMAQKPEIINLDE